MRSSRPLLLAALPWAALGVQAWWLCALQSLGVLITLRRSQTDPLVLPVTLLVLALLGALAALPDLSSAALTFAVTAPVALALGVGSASLKHGSRWGLALLAGVLLLGPTWLGLLGLLLGALALGGPDQAADKRLSGLPQGTSFRPPRQAWGWVVGAALLLLIFAALPRPNVLHRNLSPIDVVQVVNAPGQQPAARSTSRQPRPPSTALPRSERDPTLETILNAANLPLLGMALLCLALLRRGWGRAGGHPRLWSLLLGTTLLVALGLFVLGLLLQPPTPQRVVGQVIRPAQTQPQSAASASQKPPAPLPPPHLPTWLIWTVATLSLVMLVGAAWFVMTLKDAPDDAELDLPPPAGPALDGPDTPLGRVRAAYAATLQLLSQHGLTRAESETPDELLARAAVRWPEAASPLSYLTAAYRPVRYGAAPDEQGAEAAERGAAQVRAMLTSPASHPTQGTS